MTAGKDEDCSACHTIGKWSTGSFDHSTTRFPLEGGHEKVRCAQCHTQEIQRDGLQIRVYRGTGTQCSDCHVSRGK